MTWACVLGPLLRPLLQTMPWCTGLLSFNTQTEHHAASGLWRTHHSCPGHCMLITPSLRRPAPSPSTPSTPSRPQVPSLSHPAPYPPASAPPAMCHTMLLHLCPLPQWQGHIHPQDLAQGKYSNICEVHTSQRRVVAKGS